MRRFRVSGTEDGHNPVPSSVLTRIPSGRTVVYHGTSSAAADEIEKVGFSRGRGPYTAEDLNLVREGFRKLGYYGDRSDGFATVDGFAGSCADRWGGKRPPYFSTEYLYARNYSTARGGETIEALLIAIEDFGRLALDDQVYAKHLDRLERELAKYPAGMPDWKGLRPHLAASQDRAQIRATHESFEPLAERWRSVVESHVPAILAVAAAPEWFEPPAGPGGINLAAVRDIEPSALVARVDLPAEALYLELESFPLASGAWRVIPTRSRPYPRASSRKLRP